MAFILIPFILDGLIVGFR